MEKIDGGREGGCGEIIKNMENNKKSNKCTMILKDLIIGVIVSLVFWFGLNGLFGKQLPVYVLIFMLLGTPIMAYENYKIRENNMKIIEQLKNKGVSEEEINKQLRDLHMIK